MIVELSNNEIIRVSTRRSGMLVLENFDIRRRHDQGLIIISLSCQLIIYFCIEECINFLIFLSNLRCRVLCYRLICSDTDWKIVSSEK